MTAPVETVETACGDEDENFVSIEGGVKFLIDYLADPSNTVSDEESLLALNAAESYIQDRLSRVRAKEDVYVVHSAIRAPEPLEGLKIAQRIFKANPYGDFNHDLVQKLASKHQVPSFLVRLWFLTQRESSSLRFRKPKYKQVVATVAKIPRSIPGIKERPIFKSPMFVPVKKNLFIPLQNKEVQKKKLLRKLAAVKTTENAVNTIFIEEWMVLIPKYCARYPGQKAAVDKEHAKLEKEKETLVTIYNKISARVQNDKSEKNWSDSILKLKKRQSAFKRLVLTNVAAISGRMKKSSRKEKRPVALSRK